MRYDAAGNLNQIEDWKRDKTRIASITHNLLKHYLGMEFDYDAESNTVRKIVKGKDNEQPYLLTLHHDAESRLVKAGGDRERVVPRARQT